MVRLGVRKTTVYLTEDIEASLKAASRASGRREADLVREALRTYLRTQLRPRPTIVGIGDDHELAASESKRWVRQQWSKRW